MARERLIVIGAVAAGTKAASKAKREKADLDVKIFSKEENISYAGCGLPYYIGGIIKEKKELLVRTPEIFKKEQDIEIYIKHEVTKINVNEKKVTVLNLENTEITEYEYDKLIIATGATPFVPPLENVNLKNIFTLRSVTDAFAIREMVDMGKAKKAVVVGGGFIGLEVAENLKHRGVDVTLFELVPHILPPFDEEIALFAQNHMKEKGVDIITGEKVTGFEGDSEGVKRVITSVGSFEADIVILSIGVRPNVSLAKAAGIELGVTGAIKVNEFMETNIKDIYAAGDCIENVNLVTGKAAWYPMGSTSNKTGRIAGQNCVSDLKDSLEGVLGTTIVKLFDVSAAKTGLSERDAIKEGFEVETVLVPMDDRAHYYPGHKNITTKLIADKKTHKVLGAQIIGEGVVDKPIDIIATAITFGADLEGLSKLDLAYAPPFSTAMSSTLVVSNVLLNKLNQKMEGINPAKLPEKIQRKEVNVVDVREEVEFFISAIPESVNIPINELENRCEEINKDGETVILVCKVGRRAYTAYKKLKELGYKDVKILEGGATAYPYEMK